ncbi:hypothetical protein K469DRAFT_576233 [Zopfia rhizophila CBS 207.26]|uniref:Dockerin type 1 n=1 Tax=Zopfia rhizophila CBS 207.26 TaxID=1314779 RepID=A0A6A6E3V0_9PEZI|nr:hypothetical protein K469DRAFT_576233 [Zopfia rhizophila CBS 207.26]
MFSIKQIIFLTVLQAIAGHAAPTPRDATPVQAGAAPPASFTANPNIGPGGSNYKDSPHFRIYGGSSSQQDAAIAMLEGAYTCFVDTLGWRSSGLSYNDAQDDGPWTKVNIYAVGSLSGGAAGVMHSDYATGMSWLEVVTSYVATPGVTIHEYGHGLTYHAKNWVDQSRTGAWWETTANFIAETYKNSNLCAAARAKYNQPTGDTEVNLNKVIGDSFQVIVDGTSGSGNYYEAWPFFTFLTNNLDNYASLGANTLLEMWAQYSKGSNETPLHTLARLSTSITVPKLVGRYWARMAYADIGSAQISSAFQSRRSNINYANLDQTGSSGGTTNYRVKSSRQPRYMGSNIIPLKKSGAVTVNVSVTNTSGAFTATLAIRNTSSGTTRYVELVNGSGSTSVANGEEATLVVANTPNLIQYDPFSLSSDVMKGLNYQVAITGATA